MNDKEEDEKAIKVILLGESGVGKTSIIKRYINNEFSTYSESTLGSTFLVKDIIKKKITYKLVIWDTSGQEKYHSVTNLFINNSNIVILIYSIDSRISFEGLDYWYNMIKERLEGEKYILAIVGSKSDLIDEEAVPEEEGKKFANSKNAIFKLVSAKSFPEGINDLFNTLLEELIKRGCADRPESIAILKRNRKLKKKKKFC